MSFWEHNFLEKGKQLKFLCTNKKSELFTLETTYTDYITDRKNLFDCFCLITKKHLIKSLFPSINF